MTQVPTSGDNYFLEGRNQSPYNTSYSLAHNNNNTGGANFEFHSTGSSPAAPNNLYPTSPYQNSPHSGIARKQKTTGGSGLELHSGSEDTQRIVESVNRVANGIKFDVLRANEDAKMKPISDMVNNSENQNHNVVNQQKEYEASSQTLQIVNDVVRNTTSDMRAKQDTGNILTSKKHASGNYNLPTTTSNAPTTPITPCTPILTVEELKQTFRFDETLAGESIPVTCRSAQGTLFKNRLGSGKKGRCIKVNNDYMTPWEFESLGGRSGSKDWKRSIRYQGRPINDLMLAGFISFHAPSCTCRVCSDDPNGSTVSSDNTSSSASVRYFTPYKRKARSESSSNNKTAASSANGGLSTPKKLKTLVPIAPSPAAGNGSSSNRPPLNSSKSAPAQHSTLLTSASVHDASGTLTSTPISQVAAIGGGSNTAIYLSNVDQNSIQNQQQPQQQQQHHIHGTGGGGGGAGVANHQLHGGHNNSNAVNMSSNLLSGNTANNASNSNTSSSGSNNSSLAALVPALESISNQITHLGNQVDLILNAVKKDLLRDSSPQPRGGSNAATNGELIGYIPSGSNSATAVQLKSEKVCNNCGRETTSMCSGCNKAYYCSDFCIQKDWGNHANFCDVQPILTPASPQKMQSIFGGNSVLNNLNLDNNSKQQQQNSSNVGQTTQIYLATSGQQHQQSNTTQIINASNAASHNSGNTGNSGNATNSAILLNSSPAPASQGMQLSLPKQLNLIPNSLNANSSINNSGGGQGDANSLNSRNSSDLNPDQISTSNNVATLAGATCSNSTQQFLIQTSSGATLVLPANFLTNINSNVSGGGATIPISDQEALENLLASAT